MKLRGEFHFQIIYYALSKFKKQIQMSDNKKWKPNTNFAQSTVSTTFLTMSAYRERRQLQNSPNQYMSSSIPSVTNFTTSKVEQAVFKKNIKYDKQPLTLNVNQKFSNLTKDKNYLTILENKSVYPVKNVQNRKESQKGVQMEGMNKNEKGKYSYNYNLETIMQKINKKQQLINQLRQLSKVSVSDMIKNNNTKNNKTNSTDQTKREYYSQSNKDKQGTQANKVKISFRRSVADYKEPATPQLPNTFKLKMPRQINKNPEQQSSDFKTAKNGYYTHRQIQSKITQSPPILGYSSVQNSIIVPKDKKMQKLNISYTLANEGTTQKSMFTPRGQDTKNIQQMRLKRTKNNSIYFSTKITSIYQFQILKTLGEGKFGKVVQAIHKATNSIYAIKKIQKKVIKDSMMIEQLIKEIKIQNFCKHQNILQLFGVFDDRQFIYLVLEYMEQGTLFNQLKKRRIFSQKEASIKLKCLAKAIVYLHDNGIAHRDIKPQNIVMSNGIAKLCDFGWATLCQNGRRTTYCGTFDYAAPEILQGVEYDMSVDLWCLGILAYELMVGKAPFYHISRKQTIKRIINVENELIKYPANLSKDAVSFIEGLIKKNPQQRMNGMNILIHPFMLKAQQQ